MSRIPTLALLLLFASSVSADDANRLRALDTTVLRGAQAREASSLLSRDVRARLAEANRRDTEAWRRVQSKVQWERFRDARIDALRRSLGDFPDPPKDLNVRVTATRDGEGYKVDNIVFTSRPGLLVPANLYRPARPTRDMPGVLIVHSHHNPKTQGELQDMGATWARQGCLVLVPDQLGHGERRQHPFADAASFAGTFRPGRQDYYFRYNSGIQLHLVGDSLIGWMAWDLSRGVALLLAQPGIDPKRIVLVGSVAGGGDPAAVTAAIDRRIAVAVLFNFGGPQPETTYPLPDDAEARFNYAGGGSWESTRNLRLSARDGFLPWTIVGAAAPRGLVYAHEFAWDRDRDPVWKRLQRIYQFYDADRLGSIHGRGSVRGSGPENTHCNNVGPEHRAGLYPLLDRWLGMPAPAKEFSERRPAADLLCLTPETAKEMTPLTTLVADLGRKRSEAARRRLDALDPEERRRRLRLDWASVLGDIEPRPARPPERQEDKNTERILLEVDSGVVVPLLLLKAPEVNAGPPALVVCVCQEGKAAFLKARADAVATLLAGGASVCLVDVRGTGETSPGGGRGRTSSATSLSSAELMLGQTLVGARLRDLRAVLAYLRTRDGIGADRLALWGDALAPVNAEGTDLKVPLDADRQPTLAEPLGDLLALFGLLFEDGVRAAYARGGLASYQSVLRSPFVNVPHDVVVPGALKVGDLDDVTRALAPRPLRREGLVDGLNRRVGSEPGSAVEAARWLLDALRR